MKDQRPGEGDLRVWHIPQVPMEAFHVPVASRAEGRLVLRALADYDLFQLKHRIKPNYCNAQGMQVFEDGEWVDDEEADAASLPQVPDLVVGDQPTDPVGVDTTAVDLPPYLDVIASHIRPEDREFTVRVYRCDSSDRRDPNETLARVFDSEARARDFFSRTQNVWNVRVRSKEAPAYDVVLGVQDRRKHAKKKSHRELDHALCKGGPA